VLAQEFVAKMRIDIANFLRTQVAKFLREHHFPRRMRTGKSQLEFRERILADMEDTDACDFEPKSEGEDRKEANGDVEEEEGEEEGNEVDSDAYEEQVDDDEEEDAADDGAEYE
jgi:hypothetical protein